MIPPRNRSRPPPRVPPEWRKALREYAFEQERETVTCDTHGQGDTVQNTTHEHQHLPD